MKLTATGLYAPPAYFGTSGNTSPLDDWLFQLQRGETPTPSAYKLQQTAIRLVQNQADSNRFFDVMVTHLMTRRIDCAGKRLTALETLWGLLNYGDTLQSPHKDYFGNSFRKGVDEQMARYLP